MRNYIYALFLFPACLNAQQIPAQQSNVSAAKLYKQETPVVCYSGGEIRHSVAFPGVLLTDAHARTKSAQFEVVYTGFENFPEAQAAFQFAVDVWATLIDSPVPIRIDARFEALDAGVLGSASPGTFSRNFDNTPQWNVWFPVALAEKISGTEINGAQNFDITASFSNTANWYFDTSNPDGIAGTGKTDFATVVLHEIGHGLGFMGAANVDGNGTGSLGLIGFPMTYTTFAETISGDNLLKDIQNNSIALGDALTGDQLVFQGTTILDARLFAPAQFSQGSSFSHLDEATYAGGSGNELMTPSIGSNGFIHDPGIALDIMYDYGWEFTYILHDPLRDTEDMGQLFNVFAKVTSDTGFDTTSLILHYSTDAFTSEDILLLMTPTANPDEYQATIPNSVVATTYSYYIEVNDAKGRRFTDPGQAPAFTFYQFQTGEDNEPPVITHIPIDFLLSNNTSVDISASITDSFMGVNTALVEYFVNDVAQPAFGLNRDPQSFSNFSGTMILSFTNAGDVVTYRIIAVDSAISQNTAFDPATGFHSFLIESTPDPVTTYFNDFNSPSSDFFGDGFSVDTPAGFSDGAIHSLHPYEPAGQGNAINYLYQLKIPIFVTDDQTQVQFDEVVLVEPGETGTIFGDVEFWDYVVVEASKDDGTTWNPLLDGYDSRADTAWLTRYNSAMDGGNNSIAEGDASLYRQRLFNITDSPLVNAGDTIMLRFRMFSDEAAIGWGWAIDNLKIQQAVQLPPTSLEVDSLALLDLYNATGGATWFDDTNWLIGNVSTWYGVTVQGDRVFSIDLVDNNLVGSIPASIGDLTGLDSLFIWSNDFFGTAIPVEIGNMTSLKSLDLFDTGIGGNLPASLGNLAQLSYLSL
ncbi:MAG: hypothetical protein IIB82_17800, partial [Bacteroidetes bacterium]|nr:hypothetical protein [Bacteroidota bacterium]